MKIITLLKSYRDASCLICSKHLKQKLAVKISIPIEIDLCTACAYIRKQSLFALRDCLPINIRDLKKIGIIIKAIGHESDIG